MASEAIPLRLSLRKGEALFNVYYRNLKTGNVCRFASFPMTHEVAERMCNLFNDSPNEHPNYGIAWIAEH